jgi:hypothetical protein
MAEGNIENRETTLEIPGMFLENLIREEEKWSNQPDYGPSHVKSIRDLRKGVMYRIHYIEPNYIDKNLNREIGVKEYEVRGIAGGRSDYDYNIYTAVLDFVRDDPRWAGTTEHHRERLADIGLVPLEANLQVGGIRVSGVKWGVNWLEDPTIVTDPALNSPPAASQPE